MSNDMVRTCQATAAVDWYFQNTQCVARMLAAMFQVFFPEAYQEYKAAFDAGIWVQADPGPWLGRAIVHKLQVSMHYDRNDAGPTASFPVGQYTGGHMEVAELQARFL